MPEWFSFRGRSGQSTERGRSLSWVEACSWIIRLREGGRKLNYALTRVCMPLNTQTRKSLRGNRRRRIERKIRQVCRFPRGYLKHTCVCRVALRVLPVFSIFVRQNYQVNACILFTDRSTNNLMKCLLCIIYKLHLCTRSLSAILSFFLFFFFYSEKKISNGSKNEIRSIA